MEAKLISSSGVNYSIQISHLEDISGTYNGIFLIKNITDDNITASIKLVEGEDYISTVLYPGWNPEICQSIKDVTAGTLLVGF